MQWKGMTHTHTHDDCHGSVIQASPLLLSVSVCCVGFSKTPGDNPDVVNWQ